MDVGNNPEQANQTSSHQRPCDNGEHFSMSFSSGAANSESGGNEIGGLQVDSASHADSLHALPATAVPSAGELVNSVQGGLPSGRVTPGPSNTPSVPGPSTSTNPVRRKLGRPKGSKNKLQNPSSLTVRRPVGRPRGSGPKQKARAASAASLPTGSPVNTVTAKRPVGRPKKAQATSGVTVEFGNFSVPRESISSRQQSTVSSPPINIPPASPPQSTAISLQTGAANSRSSASGPPRTDASVSSTFHNGGSAGAEAGPSSSSLEKAAAGVDIVSSSPSTGPSGSKSTPASNHTCRVIPTEDPQRLVDLEDEEVDAENSGDGIGDEDAEDETKDEADDEQDPEQERTTQPEAAGKPSPPRCPLPTWLLEAFEARVAESATDKRDEKGQPHLYSDHHSFWFPQPSTFFLLRRNNLAPHHLFNPRFFLWDPMALCDGIPCPNCRKKLQRHSHISRPRRCVDSNSTFWIIGYRYRCRSCINPKSGKNTLTFRSWDSRILAMLPSALASEFPARLSHRSGISHTLFAWVRSCIQNGMGVKQVSDALRVQHLLRYDEIHLQYLDFLAVRRLDGWTGKKYEAFLPFDNKSPRGLHGFVPSAQWIRDMYDRFMEEHRHDCNQHTSMLGCTIGSLDHSHKITKHIAKVGGERVFTALLTVTNQNGEIRSCNLVATKSHSQFELALKKIEESLKLYGHLLPLLFYTDNMSDKLFLERCFPSLRLNVVPIEKYAHLEPYQKPSHTSIFTMNTDSSINNAMGTILDDVSTDTHDSIVVGFDSEWNVQVSEGGQVCRRGKTAIIQIAYKNRVYLLQVGDMLAGGRLPHQLQLLLEHPRILKAGRLVNADLKYLQEATHSSTPFVSALDLAKYAKDRQIVTSAQCSLADLCAVVLGKCLNKNVSERISDAWENDTLTKEQESYAARDASVALLIYEKLSAYEVPQPLPPQVEPGIPVLIYSADNTNVVARGVLSSHLADNTFDTINVTATHTVVDVLEVLVPGAIITTHHKRALESFGNAPFTIVCLRSHLRVFHVVPQLASSSHPMSRATDPPDSSSFASNSESTEPPAVQPLTDSDGSSIGDVILDHVASEELPSAPPDYPRQVDPQSAADRDVILEANPPVWDRIIHSRILKDVFHVFNMFHLPAMHGLTVEFARELRNAIFIPDAEDRKRIEAWGSTQCPMQTFDQIQAKRPSWLWRRCKRVIPPPNILHPLVDQVFRTYGPLKDAATGVPLFNHANWKTARHILDLIRDGFVSDPPGIPLYTVIGLDAKAGGLPLYRCSRGTNQTEGGVHAHLRTHMPSSGTSVRHAQACLLDFVLHHNLLVGTFNTTGQHYRGHFSIWITNKIQERLTFLEDILVDPYQITGWINGNLYVSTSEVLGILPVPDDVRLSSGMVTYTPSLDGKQKHHFLAAMQGTRKPILPIHTATEKQLFRDLMDNNKEFNPTSTGPIWKEAVKVWNRYADGNEDIFYKLIEQLKVYHVEWKKNLNIKESLSVSYSIRKPLHATLTAPSRSIAAPSVPEQPCQPHAVTAGLLPIDSPPPISTTPPAMAPSTSNSQPAASSSQSQSQSHSAQKTKLARKRVANDILDTRPVKKTRKRRTCAKCAVPSCPGSQKVSNCKNACRDCKKRSCRGRNSKNPTEYTLH